MEYILIIPADDEPFRATDVRDAISLYEDYSLGACEVIECTERATVRHLDSEDFMREMIAERDAERKWESSNMQFAAAL